MKRQIKAIDISNHSNTKKIELILPDTCPSCLTALEPTILTGMFLPFDSSDSDDIGMLYVLYHCPKCDECFLGKYHYHYGDYLLYHAQLICYLPHPKRSENFPQNIQDVSPKFVEIYNQAFLAEQQGLTEICGLGYRKALEFLVKDYAIFLNENDSDSIKPMHLANCIDKYIESSHIRNLAKASAWIGNDETHYTRKHEDYGLSHLKSFIAAATSLISSELSAMEASNLLSQKK